MALGNKHWVYLGMALLHRCSCKEIERDPTIFRSEEQIAMSQRSKHEPSPLLIIVQEDATDLDAVDLKA